MTTKITEKNISSIANTAVQWQSVHVADGSTALTTSAGKGYFIDTTSAAATVNLPSVDDSTLGDTIILKDFARKWGTNNVTIAANTYEGNSGSSRVFSTEGQSVTLVFTTIANGWQLINDDTVATLGPKYVAATGGTVATSGDFKIHTFTGDGCFVVSCAGNSNGNNKVDYLVVAGGGSGGSGSGNSGGGGGAGGTRESHNACVSGPYTASPLATPVSITVTASTFPISVGAGGAALPASGNAPNACGLRGSNSVFATITSAGGGGGGNAADSITNGPGGSGGGAAGGGQCRVAGAGNTPPTSPPQGNPGGRITPPHSPDISAGGGGGAGAAGNSLGPEIADSNPQQYGANGGVGITTSINGTATGFSGGGGGGSYNNPGAGEGNNHNWPNGKAPAPGVAVCAVTAFGGGKGGNWNNPTSGAGGENAGANKGAGGGGTGYNNSGAGGKGIVILRYKFQN